MLIRTITQPLFALNFELLFIMQCLDLRRINVEDWMQGCKKVILQHGSRPYVLTITRRGKLILTAAETPLEPSAAKPSDACKP